MKTTNRCLVIGDVHGGYKGLIQVLERAKFDKEKDTLISLGDIADGWSEVPECVDYLLSCKNIIAIRGNHDKWCQDWIIMGHCPKIWTQQGGQATIDAYIRTNKLTDESHRDFFKKQINYYIDDDNRGFVHGGFTSRKGLGHEPYESNYFWDRDLWQLAMLSHNRDIPQPSLVEDISYEQRYLNHKEVFIGHTSTINWNIDKPMNKCNVWNLDTGGGFDGKITVMDVDTKEYWQSDKLKDLYPNELGR